MRNSCIGLFLAASLWFVSCCDPVPRQSFPQVVYSTYKDTAIKDAGPTIPPSNTFDSLYYPIYSFDIKNTGSEADTFAVTLHRENGYYSSIFYPVDMTIRQFILAGETKTFKTFGPIPRNALDTTRYRYLSFFTSTPDSIPLAIMRPDMTISYGSSVDGPESCGSPAKTLTVNVDSLKKN